MGKAGRDTNKEGEAVATASRRLRLPESTCAAGEASHTVSIGCVCRLRMKAKQEGRPRSETEVANDRTVTSPLIKPGSIKTSASWSVIEKRPSEN